MGTETALAPLVALEGIDGSGKGTQAARLVDRLTGEGRHVELISFPRYSATFFGRRIGDFLNGRFGALAEVDPFLVSLLYSADRFESVPALEDARSRADIVILDRYVHSNIAHQTAKALPERRAELRSWIEHVEYGLYGLAKPQLTILLDLPVAAAQVLIGRKSQRSYTDSKADLQEADAEYLQAVSDYYRHLAEEPGWHVVPVTDSGTYRPVEAITSDLLDLVRPLLPDRTA